MMNAGRLQRIGDWARANRFALAIIAPTIIVLLLLTIFPMVYSIYISFHDYYLPRPYATKFSGLANYAQVLTDARFWVSLKQTGYFIAGAISVEFVIGLALALFFFEEFRGRSFKALYLPMILVPMMIAPVVVGYMSSSAPSTICSPPFSASGPSSGPPTPTPRCFR